MALTCYNSSYFMGAQQEIKEEPLSNYEAVADPGLRRFFAEKAEPTIQGYQEWPIGTGAVPDRFSHIVGLDKYYVGRLLLMARKKGVMDFIVGNSTKNNSYLLDRNGVRAFLALCYVSQEAMLVRRRLSLEDAVAETKKELGSHPLKDLLHDPKPNQFREQRVRVGPRLPVFDRSSVNAREVTEQNRKRNGDKKKVVPQDWEEESIERADGSPLSKAPHIAPEQLEAARRLDKRALTELLEAIPDWPDEVSFQKIPLKPDEVRMIVFIHAVETGRLAKYDPQLEFLNYLELRAAVRTCRDLLTQNHSRIQNVADLFLAKEGTLILE